MKVTDISLQVRDKNRVNVSVDGTYLFSLDILQVSELDIKKGKEYTKDQIGEFIKASQYGRLYVRALEYALVRPRSVKEMRDYLYRKTLSTKKISRKTGKVIEVHGVSEDVTKIVLAKLVSKGYVDDSKFAKFWLENRNVNKGMSIKKLKLELTQKGVGGDVVSDLLKDGIRDDIDELKKIIKKKSSRYQNQQKLTAYLMSQGFHYSDIKDTLSDSSDG